MYKKILVVLVALGLATVLLAACGIRDINPGGGPTVHMGGASFIQDSITIHKGDSVLMVDDAASPHIVVNGSWVNGQAVAKAEPGAPTVNLNFKGNDSTSTPVFNTAGTFHLYCTLHGNMNLTVVVQ
jgi:plastocyanin